MALAEAIYQVIALRKGYSFWGSCMLAVWSSMLQSPLNWLRCSWPLS